MSDNLRKYKSLYSSTSNSFGTGTGVTITPATVTGLPTDTEITLTFDREETGKIERIIGTISGGNFVVRTSPSSGRGADSTTDQAHTSPNVEMVFNAKDWNDMIEWALTEHNQDGTHDDSKVAMLAGTQTITGDKTFSGALKVDTISEKTADNGVVIDSVTLKDGGGTFTGKTQFNTEAVFDAEYDNGNSGSADTIDWTKGNKQKSTLTDDVTYTFTAPSGACNLILHIVQDGTGGRDATWPASVTWLGTEPTWSDGGASKSIIVSFYYDGTTYWAQGTSWES